MRICTEKCKMGTAFGVGSTLIIVGILAVIFWVDLYNSILHSQLSIQNGSKVFDMWKETPIPMYLSLYLYNWTNYKEVLNTSWKIKPKFEQCGPYVFLEHHSRVNLKWNSNGTMIKYQQRRKWNFQPSMSNGSLDDEIINLNVIAATVAYFVKDRNILIQKAVDLFLREKEREMYLIKTAGQWMFEGFDDEVLALMKKLNISGMGDFDKFGWFYKRNNSNTYDGVYTMYTGTDDIELVGILEEWNNSPVSPDYKSYCGYVNGTSGELWPPVKKYDKVHVFSCDICSSAALFKSNNTPTILGIQGKQYVGTDFLFDNGTQYPEQECFNGERVFPSGVRDVSKCKFGAPAFVSYPHFYMADPIYRENISGMDPNPEKHNFQLTIEPDTGVPLNVNARLQINLFLYQIKGISMFKDVKETMFPMLWFEQSAELTEDFSGQIKFLLVLPNVGTFTGYGFIGVGILIGLISAYVTFKNGWKDKDTEQLLPEKSL